MTSEQNPAQENAGAALAPPISTSTALTLAPPPGSFALSTQANTLDLMQQGFDSGVTIYQLPRVKVPSSGLTVWSVQTADGEKNPRELDVIIVLIRPRLKSWWVVSGTTTGVPPDCSSNDSIKGNGMNGATLVDKPDGTGKEWIVDPKSDGVHDCISCKWNSWKSDRQGGKGKDCKDLTELYFMRDDSRMPTLLGIPPGSLKAFTEYTMRLIDGGIDARDVVTKLSLLKDKNDRGQEYSKLDFRMVRRLTDAEIAKRALASEKVMAWIAPQSGARMPAAASADLNG